MPKAWVLWGVVEILRAYTRILSNGHRHDCTVPEASVLHGADEFTSSVSWNLNCAMGVSRYVVKNDYRDFEVLAEVSHHLSRRACDANVSFRHKYRKGYPYINISRWGSGPLWRQRCPCGRGAVGIPARASSPATWGPKSRI